MSAIFVVVLSSGRIYFVLTGVVMQVPPFSGLVYSGKTNPDVTAFFRNDPDINVFADGFLGYVMLFDKYVIYVRHVCID